jgi:hypothetical protein
MVASSKKVELSDLSTYQLKVGSSAAVDSPY